MRHGSPKAIDALPNDRREASAAPAYRLIAGVR
jgi:hypothetical protein